MQLKIVRSFAELVSEYNIVQAVLLRNQVNHLSLDIEDSTFSQAIISQASKNSDTIFVLASDIIICTFTWPNGEVTCFPFSASGHYYVESDFWLHYFPFLNHFGEKSWQLNYKLFDIRRMDEPVILFGGFHQWGHFLQDILPRTSISDSFPKFGHLVNRSPFLCTPQRSWEQDVLKTLAPNKVFLPVLAGCQLLFCKRVGFAVKISPEYSRLYVQHAVSRYKARRQRSQCGTVGSDGPRLVYLTRGAKDRHLRVSNISMIDDWATRRGFVVLQGESLTTGQLIDVLENVSIVLTDPLTPLVNFACFAPQSARAICLIPEDVYNSPTEQYLEGGLTHLAGHLDRVFFVPGQRSGDGDSCVFEIEAIESTFLRLSERLAQI